jgi:hypothetical protein
LALCWIGFILVFFTFSTTQEYYSMPCYPALALLLGSAMAMDGAWVRRGTAVLTAIASCAAAAAIAILVLVRNVATPGDIFSALVLHPSAYTLSLGHMEDLTMQSFAYLRTPLLLAAIAFVIGAVGTFRAPAKRAFVCITLMMLLFFQAARLALVAFDPDLSSRPLAEAILRSPQGKIIADRHYYAFSSIFFYTNRTGLLLNGRVLNLSYGSYAPGAPNVFIDDPQFKELWSTPERYYLVASNAALPRLERLVGREKLNIVAESGGKFVFTNSPLPNSTLPPTVADAQRPGPSRTRQTSALGAFPSSSKQPTVDHYALASQVLGFINSASVPQTRYISSRALLVLSQANPIGFPNDRVMTATQQARSDGSSVPGASLHCMSPEEDA